MSPPPPLPPPPHQSPTWKLITFLSMAATIFWVQLSSAGHLDLRQKFNSVDVHNKAVVSLGLNSILNLSFWYLEAQTVLFHRSQRNQLRSRYKPKKYNIDRYKHLLQLLGSIQNIYNKSKNFDSNWLNLYRELKKLYNKYDSNENPEYNDVNFCIHMLLHILSIIKKQPHLFDDDIDSSEWDFVVKFWGVVTERLFEGTHLRLKWGDTHLTVHDTVSDLLLKVDLRILHDKVRQRFNVETDVGTFEAAEEKPGNVKYVGDRCKVMIESKAIIDRFLLDGCLIYSVDSLQVCGLEIHFGDTTLAEPGLYVGNQFYTAAIDKSIKNISKYLNLAFHLLCFRDQCVEIYNEYEDHLTSK